jgi:hypothetical protein
MAGFLSIISIGDVPRTHQNILLSGHESRNGKHIIWVFLIVQDGFQMIPTVIGSNGFGATLNLNRWRLTPPSVRPQDMRYRLLGTVEQVMDSEMDVPELEDHGDPWRKDLGKT